MNKVCSNIKRDLESIYSNSYKNEYEVSSDVAYIVITHYIKRYFVYTGKHHLLINKNQLHGILKNMGTDEEEIFLLTGDFDMDIYMYKRIIEKHFNTRYQTEDYNIWHFLSGKIKTNRYYEVFV